MRWPLLAGVLPLLPLLVLLDSLIVPAQRLPLLATRGEPVVFPPFHLNAGWFGSPELDLRADLPANSTVVLSVDLLDGAGRPLLQFRKEGWREQGTWMEQGEQGTYDEGDTATRLDLRPGLSGVHQLRVQVDDLLDASGQPLLQPVPLLLTVRHHSLNRPLLLLTALAASSLLALYWTSVYGGCRRRLRQRVDDEHLALRFEAGGPGLLRLIVRARFERGTGTLASLQIPLALSLSDAWGRCLLRQRKLLPLNGVGSDGEAWIVRQSLWLRIAEPRSLRMQVSLACERGGGALELEWLELLVEDGRLTPWPVAVTPLQPEPAPSRPAPA
jgi:hypothetical protein